ncbi:amidohydrolase family protein [Mycobacterium sp. URHD0025]|uniref:amidohydrolase family protein n=1 Tax=Mycobacterium sp. URHD0025 TaxID=1298864 RepID=UPI000422FEA0|nr:amidohydrolase family protein [Mycobacterium sp. URHD0025]
MSNTIAFEGATLIDGKSDTPNLDATVLVEGDRIAAVGRRGTVDIPHDAEQVDLTGKWLLPGLINGNVHLLDSWMMLGVGGIEYIARHEFRFEEVIIEAAQVALREGVTTVFDTHNAVGPVLAARDRIASGAEVGARVFAAGNIVGMGGPFSADFFLAARPVITSSFANRINQQWEAGVGHQISTLPVREIRAIVRDYLDRGVDMMKVAVSDHLLSTVGVDRTYLPFSETALRVMFEEARSKEVPILTHTLSTHALDIAVDLEADVLVHASVTLFQPIENHTIDKILDQGISCGIQTVTDAYQSYLESRGEVMAGYGGGQHAKNEQTLIAAGANVFLGTDAGCTPHDVLNDLGDAGRQHRPWTLGTDHFDWTVGIMQKGMTSMQAIHAATSNVAKAYGKFDEIGSIEVGKYADLLVLDADPVADIDNLRKINSIYKAGRLVDRSALPHKRFATADLNQVHHATSTDLGHSPFLE